MTENAGYKGKNSHTEIFEALFQVTDRFCGKKILLYGLSADTKKAMMFLAFFHISIEGFLAAKNEDELAGMQYVGKPVLSKADFFEKGTADYTILDVYGDFLEEIWDVFQMRGDILFAGQSGSALGQILIYGTGGGGQKLSALLGQSGIKILCYCARSTRIKDWMTSDCKIILPDALDCIDKTVPVAIAIHNMEDAEKIRNLLTEKGFSKVWNFDPDFFDTLFSLTGVAIRTGGEYQAGLSPYFLRYLLRALPEQRRILFFTNDIPYGLNVISTLHALGITSTRIVTEIRNESAEDQRVVNGYDLIYEEPSDFFIFALPGDEENAKEFMRKSGLPWDMFFLSYPGLELLKREYVLDTHLGYVSGSSNIVVRNGEEGVSTLKVAVLGGSTSDYDLFFEESWPDWLLKLAKISGIRMECIMAATGGNTSSQELIRLIRDVIWKKPDIVISYSGVNEWGDTVENYRFTHFYQKQIFELLSRSKESFSFFGVRSEKAFSMGGRRPEDNIPANWLANERMMHTVCQEFGILFYGILQPCLTGKNPKSKADSELIEHGCVEPENMLAMTKLEEYVKQEKHRYPWLHDFTDIFDGTQDETYFDFYHVCGQKNRLIAERILPIIQEAIKENK